MIENERQVIQNESKCSTISKNIKLSLFNLYHNCQLSITVHPFISAIIILLSYINIITYLFHEDSHIYNASSNADYIKMFPRIFNIAYYFKQSTLNTKVFLIIISIFLLSSLSLQILLFFHSQKTSSMLYAIFYMSTLIVYWILLLPIIDISINIICDYNVYSITYVIFSVINILVLIYLSVLHSLFGHSSHFSMKKSNGFSRVDCNYEIFYLIIRLVIIIIFLIVVRCDLSYWIIIGVNIAISIIAISFNSSKFIFYCSIVSSMHLFSQLLHLYSTFIAIIITSTKYKEPFWLFALGFIALFFAAKGIIERTVMSTITSRQLTEMLTSPYLADKCLKELAMLIASDSSKNIVVDGISDFFDKECNNEKKEENNNESNGVSLASLLSLSSYDKFYIPSKKGYMTKENFTKKEKYYNLCFLLSLYNFYIKNAKKSTILLSYLNFQYEDIGNYIDLLFNLYNAKVSYPSLSLQEEFALYRMKMQTISKCEVIYNYSFTEIEKTKLNISNVIDYYTMVTVLKRKMIESANASFTFWNNFAFNSDNKNIYQNGLELFEYNRSLEMLYKKIRNIYSRDDYLNMKFSEYIRVVKGDDKLASKYQNENDFNLVEHIDEIREAEKLNNLKEFFFSGESVILIVNFTNDRNSIEKSTESVFSLFGYSAHQIIGKEMEHFMPPFFKERHAKYVEYHFLTGIKNIIGKSVMLYGYNSKHFCFSLRVMVMMLPSIDTDRILYMAAMQKINTDYALILCHSNGKIDAISEKMSKILKLNNDDIIENDIYIYHIVMNMLTYIKNGKEKILEHIGTFSMSQNDLTKMKYCTDPNIVMNFRKAMKQHESHSGNNFGGVTSMRDIIKMYINSIESATWPLFETEISEEKYHSNATASSKDNTLYIVKVFIDDDEDITNNNIQLETIGNIDNNNNTNNNPSSNNNNFNSLATINSEDNDKNNDEDSSRLLSGSQKNEQSAINNNKIIIKNLNYPSSVISKNNRIKAILEEENNLKEQNKKNNNNYQVPSPRKFKRYDALSSITSNMSSAIYANYSNFLKKLNKHLTESPRSLFAQIIALILLLIEVVSSIVIFIFEYNKLTSIKDMFTHVSYEFSRYDDLNCVEKLFNDDIISKAVFNESRSQLSIEMFDQCIDNIIKEQNYIGKITKNQMINDIKLNYLTTNVTIYQGLDIENKTVPASQFMMMLIDYTSKLNRTEPFYTGSNGILRFIRNNFYNLIETLFNESNRINIDEFKENITEVKKFNWIYLTFRLCVIMISFIVILPILIIKKKEQIQILENFFTIKTEDAEMQKEACRRFLETSTNLKLEDNNNNKSGNNLNEEEKKEEIKKNSNEKGDHNNNDNFAFNSHSKEKDKRGSGQQSKGKKHPTTFSSKFFIITTIISIICIILILSIIPIVGFMLQLKIYNKSLDYITNKDNVDQYAFYMEQTIIQTQNIILTAMLNQQIESSLISQYNSTYQSLFKSEVAFNDFTSLSYDLSHYDELYSFLQQDMCEVFSNHNFNINNCDAIQVSNSQKGMKPIYSQITSILTDISQTLILGYESLNSTSGLSLYQSNNYQYLSQIVDQFVIEGFDLILELLVMSYNDEIDSQLNILIVLLTLFGIVLLVNQFVVWNTISAKIHTMETDTYKLFAILPIGFIIEYKSLLDFLNKITIEDR